MLSLFSSVIPYLFSQIYRNTRGKKGIFFSFFIFERESMSRGWGSSGKGGGRGRISGRFLLESELDTELDITTLRA